jgi:type IV pilus assembly protein PilA
MCKKLQGFKKSKKGFTLVELIVVLVILAILAAILVPTLIGYIDKARDEKDYATAQTIRVAAQAELDARYAANNDKTKAITSADTDGYGDKVSELAGVTLKATDPANGNVVSFTFTPDEKGKISTGNVVIYTGSSNHTYYLRNDGAWYKTAS